MKGCSFTGRVRSSDFLESCLQREIARQKVKTLEGHCSPARNGAQPPVKPQTDKHLVTFGQNQTSYFPPFPVFMLN